MTRNTMSLLYAGKCAASLLVNPKRFFSEQGKQAPWMFAFGFILVSALISSGATLSLRKPPSLWLSGSILLFNAIGMVGISTGFGYLTIWLIRGERMRFDKLFNIYAFAGSMPLLISWIPGAFWITEFWRWWLVGIGLSRTNRISGVQVAGVIGCTIGLTIIFFWSLMLII